MLKVNDTVLYGTTGVCTVESIESKKIGRVTREYYVLKPIWQSASTVYVPADNKQLLSKVRSIISPKEIEKLLLDLSKKDNIWIDNDVERKRKYGEILLSCDRTSYLLLLRTLYSKQCELSHQGKRLHIADERIMKEIQRLIYDEFAVAMKLTVEEVTKRIKTELGVFQAV